MRILTALCILALSGSGILGAAEKANQAQGAVTRRATRNSNATSQNATQRGYSAGTGAWEVLATNFVIAAGTCLEFNSSLDYMGSDTVAITILALDIDIRQSRIIPFFGVSGAPYFTASSKVIEGDSFYPYIDGASGIVPVTGNEMLIRVCNGDSNDIRYTQLTAYVSHR